MTETLMDKVLNLETKLCKQGLNMTLLRDEMQRRFGKRKAADLSPGQLGQWFDHLSR